MLLVCDYICMKDILSANFIEKYQVSKIWKLILGLIYTQTTYMSIFSIKSSENLTFLNPLSTL